MRSLRQCMTSRGISAVLVLLLALMAAPGAALAQVETGSIAGTVSDPQGAVVTGAAVTVTSSTGATRSTKTSGDGSFNFSNLNPGRWEVRVEGAGFGTRTATVDVSVGTRTTLDVQLEVTTAGETVDVIAGEQGIQVNTENQTLQTVVSERELKELPTITRNPYALVQLSGNVSPADPSGRGAGFA